MLQINELFEPFIKQRARFKIAKGGRAGGKSHNIATILLLKGIQEKLLIALS